MYFYKVIIEKHYSGLKVNFQTSTILLKNFIFIITAIGHLLKQVVDLEKLFLVHYSNSRESIMKAKVNK